MRYNSSFKMRDFFMNSKMESVFPQLNEKDLDKEESNDEDIALKVQTYLSKALGGSLSGDNIVIGNKSVSNVKSQIETLKFVAEGFTDNMQSIKANVKSNRKLYTTIASVDQIYELKDEKKKLDFFNEVQDNINYNPEFGSQNSVASFSTLPYKKRQEIWKSKVGYKGKE